MRPDSPRWTEVAPSRHAHEREGLEHVRDELPDQAPYHAWSNVEFVALDGTPYEVDLVVLGPAGFHLVELKAWSGKVELDRVAGGENAWLEHPPGRGRPLQRRNPLGLTRLKAQSFRSWLEHHARGTAVQVPFVHESLLLHGTNVDCRLPDRLKQRVFGRDDTTGNGLGRIFLDRLAMPDQRGPGVDASRARALEGLVDRAGLRRPSRRPQVGHWVLDDGPIDVGWGWRDDLAHHERWSDDVVRVRRWFAPPGTSAGDETALRVAADREYRALRGLDHPGLVLPRDAFEVEGAVAALVYDHDPDEVDLASWVRGPGADAPLERRLEVVRGVAEVLRYAHDHGLAHRGLEPSAVLVGPQDRVRVRDWQLGGSADPGSGTRTTHVRDLLGHREEQAQVYSAPEAVDGPGGDRRAADVFSLGALAHLVLTGGAPAEDPVGLRARLEREVGLDLTALLDGPPDSLVEMVLESTRPVVSARASSVDDVLVYLDMVLYDLTAPDVERPVVLDPLDAQPGDVLEGGLVVRRTLGEGATSRAFLVARPDGSEAVLKAARDDGRAARLTEEAAVLAALPADRELVHLLDGPMRVGGRQCLLVELAGERTLAHHLGGDRLTLDQLRRWGHDLIAMLEVLDRAGVFHRDLKPANLGVRTRPSDGQPHLVLFDFSLAGAGADDLRAGTTGYRDPFLGGRARPAYDAAAEAFSVAVTLHEMATGSLPTWGDGRTPPEDLDDEVTVRRGALDDSVADDLAAFLRRALARHAADRFDNHEEMARGWDQVFAAAEEREATRTPDQEAAAASLSTPLPRSGLSARAVSALEQYGVATVGDLLALPPLELSEVPGARQATKNEVVARARDWRDRLTSDPRAVTGSVEATLDRLLPVGHEVEDRAVRLLLGQVDEVTGAGPLVWPTTTAVAGEIDTDRRAVGSAWRAFLGSVRGGVLEDLQESVDALLEPLGGVACADELAERLLERRGSFATGPARLAQAAALVRVAVETSAAHRTRKPGETMVVAGGAGLDVTSLDEALDVAVDLRKRVEVLSQQDALAAPATVLGAVREVAAGSVLEDLPEERLRSLAAATAGVAVSARGEVYPRGMGAGRALRLAASALVAGPTGLAEQTLAKRVRTRFPAAQPLPGRPRLDDLVAEARLDLRWDGGVYVSRTSRSTRGGSTSSSHHGAGTSDVTRVDAVLRRSIDERGFLALAVSQRHAAAAAVRLQVEHDVRVLDLGVEVTRRLRAAAEDTGGDWSFVVGADAPSADPAVRRELDGYVRSAATTVLADHDAGDARPVLLVGAGLLAQHGCTDLLKPLASLSVDRAAATWVLAPQPSLTTNPTLDGAAVPLDSPTSQWLVVPTPWALTPPTTVPA